MSNNLTVSLDQLVPFSQARANLANLIEKVKEKKFLVVTKRQSPAVALIDTDYLASLMAKKETEEIRTLANSLQSGFNNYLKQKRLVPEKMTDAQAEKILKQI